MIKAMDEDCNNLRPSQAKHSHPQHNDTAADAFEREDTPTTAPLAQCFTETSQSSGPLEQSFTGTSQSSAPLEPSFTETSQSSGTLAQSFPETSHSSKADHVDEAPKIPGVSKNRKPEPPINQTSFSSRSTPERIVVPICSINRDFKVKFDPDPRKVDLCDLMGSEEYEDAINILNNILGQSGSTKMDKFLLAMSPLVVPLAVYGRRRSLRSKERRLLLHEGIVEFNEAYPALRMKWNRSSTGDFLSIEPRTTADAGPVLSGLESMFG